MNLKGFRNPYNNVILHMALKLYNNNYINCYNNNNNNNNNNT